MTALETLIAAVQQSDQLDAGRKALAVAFLQAAGPTVISLGEPTLASLLDAVAAGRDITPAVTQNLDARGVAALLDLTETQLAGVADRRAAQTQAAQAALQTLQSAALAVLARLLIGIL
jgi:hypothetical protein